MNKVDWKNICTAPKPEWLVIHKTTGLSFCFTFDDIFQKFGRAYIRHEGPTGDKTLETLLSDCHLCAFTGYTDSDGSKVYEGHILGFRVPLTDSGFYLICWCAHRFAWIVKNLRTDGETNLATVISNTRGMTAKWKIIGHIHIPSEWPEEVKELLE